MNKFNQLKFHGKFTELIPAGWTFQKLFARNYRQYCINPAGKWSDSIRVWQHHGGYIEIKDYFTHSYAIVKHILNNQPSHPTLGIMLNRKTGEVVPYDRLQHNEALIVMKMKEASDEDVSVYLNEFYATWRRCNLEDETIEYLKKMLEMGWIKFD